MAIVFNDHPPLVSRVPDVSFSAFFPIAPVAIDQTFSSILNIRAEHRLDPVYPYLPAGYSSSNLLSRRLADLEIAVPDVTLNVAPGDCPTVESKMVGIHSLKNKIRQRDAKFLEAKS